MLRLFSSLALLLGLTTAATLTKTDGYGGSSYDASYDASAVSYAGGGGASADTYAPSGDSGNLYYYYYPVTNHSSSPNHALPTNYYPPAALPPTPLHYNDPLGGLLSTFAAFDVNSLILPALLIGGVALLLPAILSCDLELGTCVIPLPFSSNSNARSGRQLEATIPQMIDHAYQMYDAVYDSEQCRQRVVCELGGMMRNFRAKETIFTVLEQFSSPSVKKQLYILKQGALAPPNDAPTCHKLLCEKLDSKTD